MCKILIVDDVKQIRSELKTTLKNLFPEHAIYDYASTAKALEKVKELNFVEIVFFNSLKEKKPDGLDFAEAIREKFPSTMMIYINHSNLPDYDHLCLLSKFGVDNYLLEPYKEKALKFIVTNSLNRIRSLQSYRSEDHSNLEAAVDNFIETFNSTLNKELKKENRFGILNKLLRKTDDRNKRAQG